MRTRIPILEQKIRRKLLLLWSSWRSWLRWVQRVIRFRIFIWTTNVWKFFSASISNTCCLGGEEYSFSLLFCALKQTEFFFSKYKVAKMPQAYYKLESKLMMKWNEGTKNNNGTFFLSSSSSPMKITKQTKLSFKLLLLCGVFCSAMFTFDL